MRVKQNFFLWYFTHGANALFATWLRVLRHVPRVFSFWLLLRTLLAPWHRDVSLKSWRGFNPLKSAQRILWNIFSRIIGAIVRTGVLAVGLGIYGIVFASGIIVGLVYFTAPGIAIAAAAFLFTAWWSLALVTLVALLLIVMRAFVVHRAFHHVSYRRMSIVELARERWFSRVWDRMGIDPASVPPQAFKDFAVFQKVLRTHDLTVEESEDIITWEMERQIEREETRKFFAQKHLASIRPIGLGWHFGYTVHLDQFVEDLTRADRSSYADAPFFGHTTELEMLELILGRPAENNAVILGEPGVGRRMLVHELARRIRNGFYDNTPLMYMRVLRADFAAAVAHAEQSGRDPEYEVHNLFHEAAYAGNVILVVENFEKYMDAARGFSFATIVEQYAGLPTFRMIAVTSDEQFHTRIENAQAMLRFFDIVDVPEMNIDAAMKTLFMRFYHSDRTLFTYQALREIIDASERYTNTAPLPERAIDLAMEVLLSWEKHPSGPMITVEDVDRFVHQKTGIPVGTIDDGEKEQLLSLEEHFHERIIGQDEAVRVVAEAVRRMRSGMARPHRPAGSFLFLGPTGVGKTEMAKTLAEQYFGSREKVIRLDMSEYQGPQALARLMGSRANNQKGTLATLVQEHPYALLLLDELEKAESNVLDLFLQVLDEGLAHDAFGKKLNFTTMIIIATSNAGSLEIKKYVDTGRALESVKKDIIDTIVEAHVFRQEFLNRFDDVVLFQPIAGEQVITITHLLLEKFAERTEEEQNIRVTFADGVTKAVVDRGFDPLFGARSLLRFIDDAVADALAKKLIAGNLQRGEDVVFHVEDLDA